MYCRAFNSCRTNQNIVAFIQTTGVKFYRYPTCRIAPEHGDSVVTVNYCGVTAPYVYGQQPSVT